MANDLTSNPWILDTVTALVTSDDLFIRAIKWNPGAAAIAGNQVILQDKNGKEFWRGDATGANGEFVFNPASTNLTGWKVQGLKVPTIAAGRISIYLN